MAIRTATRMKIKSVPDSTQDLRHLWRTFVGKQLEEDVLKSNKESYRPHNDSPSHTASVDDTPEGPCWTPPPPDTSSPSPPQYCYRFHKWWSVYWGEALEEGHQTTVDRVTTWRMFDKTEWKPVPRG